MSKTKQTNVEDLYRSSDVAPEVKSQSRDVLETCICLSLEESMLASRFIKALLFWCEMVDGKDRFYRWIAELKEQHPELCNPLLLFEFKEEVEEEAKRLLFCREHHLSAFSTAVSNLNRFGKPADAISDHQRKTPSQSEVMHGATRLDIYCTLQI